MVWSDPEIKKLSKDFVTVADEVYLLYPEDPGNLARVKDRPDHLFFKKYGESMPAGDWNHPGTKQGIYMMGPDGEYLEGKFAASGNAGDIRRRIERALVKWDALKKQKKYANKPVPEVAWSPPPGVTGELVLRVNIRDLPRGGRDKSGARIHEVDGNTEYYPGYVKWAWNENWIGLRSAGSLVPKGSGPEKVDRSVVSQICQEVLVDNVRGQASTWRPSEVKTADVTMRLLSARNGVQRISYTGKVSMSAGSRSYDATLYGESEWNAVTNEFLSFEIVVIGLRKGASRYNNRDNDPGPAPMGVTLSLRRQ